MAWLTPTRRVVRWSPLLVAFGLAIGTLAVLRFTDRPLRGVELMIASTIVVIGALCGLQDPGRDFVHAMPVPASRRLAHRLVLLVPPLGLALMVVRRAAAAWFTAVPPAPGWGALVAFAAAGVAVCAVLTRRLGPRAVDAALSAMIALLVVAVVSERLDVPLGVAMPWWRWPVAVTSMAVAATVLATTRGVEA